MQKPWWDTPWRRVYRHRAHDMCYPALPQDGSKDRAEVGAKFWGMHRRDDHRRDRDEREHNCELVSQMY